MKRRTFLMTGSGPFLAAAPQPAPSGPLKVSIFSKHLHFLEGEAMAKAAAELGFDGVDLTVRKGGHVAPERVKQDLPPLVEVIRKQGLDVPMVTSGIVDADTPFAEDVVQTLARLGIRHYRWGGLNYAPDLPIPEQLAAFKPRVAKLAALNERYGVQAMYHTHSGIGQVGASIWDLYLLLDGRNPRAVSVNYDTAHATVEGGYGGWIHSLRLCAPYLGGVAIKDFLWDKDSRGNWRPQWRPLGEGMVNFPQFFAMLKKIPFSGPLQLHYEYPLGGADTGNKAISIDREELFTAMRKDLVRVRGWLRGVGL